MRTKVAAWLAGSSLLAIFSPAVAQPIAGADSSASVEGQQGQDEIVVTARRREELLQDVPQSISVVSGAQLEQFAIQNFEDVDQIVPGMELNASIQGTLGTTSFRGATYNAQSSTTNLVAFYLNDAPTGANDIMQATFDLGQIEFLRGTQGTSRGQSAPSGAITATTRRPDLHDFGGYASGIFTSEDGINLQGALNIPIVGDVLGLRLAGLVDENDLDGVRSIYNQTDPEVHNEAARASIRFEPMSNLSFNVMYEHREREGRAYTAVTGGPTTAGDIAPSGVPYATTNPAISSADRLAVGEAPDILSLHLDFLTVQGDWDFGRATLSYAGSYRDSLGHSITDEDEGNATPPVVPRDVQNVTTTGYTTTNELRLTSNAPVGGLFDYTLGLFHTDTDTLVRVLLAPDFFVNLPTTPEERSIFGNLNFHLGERTELSVGARYLEQERHTRASVGSSANPTLIDLDDPNDRHTEYSKTLWVASISHDLSDDLMIYASAGTSVRFPDPTVLRLSFLEPASGVVPADLVAPFIQLQPETSENFEIGVKGSFLDDRLRVNAAVFRQEFDNYIYFGPFVNFDAPGNPTARARFTTNVDAIIEGIDADATFAVTPNWTIGASASYADGRLDNAAIPCNDGNGDGVDDGGRPTFPTSGPFPSVALCTSSGPISETPNWNATLQSEFFMPVSSNMEAFVRGFYQYYPENNNQGVHFTADSYGLLNLFVGLRAPDDGWEVMAFARNALDEETEVIRFALPESDGANPSNFFSTVYTPRQVFGISLRTAFGSR